MKKEWEMGGVLVGWRAVRGGEKGMVRGEGNGEGRG